MMLEEFDDIECSGQIEDQLRKKPDVPLEHTRLYCLISTGTKEGLKEAWTLAATLDDEIVQRRSEVDRGTYLHHVVNQAPRVHKLYGTVVHLVPILYRLALKGIEINAQNNHGNTALHLACIKPGALPLCSHLIRLGSDPPIENKNRCRVIYTYKNHHCELVKGQSTAKSGLWNAVESEDLPMTRRLMKSWCRVNIEKKFKSLLRFAEETSNVAMVRVLDRSDHTNELVCHAFACNAQAVKRILDKSRSPGGADDIDLAQCDEALDPPKPLKVALLELGDWATETSDVLVENGMAGQDDYEARLAKRRTAFEDSEFYNLVEEATEESLNKALDLIQAGSVDVTVRCFSEGREGWSLMHYVVYQYMNLKVVDEELSRLLIRAMYRLVLAGLDINAKDAVGETALLKSAPSQDQALMTHLICLGSNTLLVNKKGETVSETVYEDRGKLIFGQKFRFKDLPGLWPAVELNDPAKAERWLKTWARVTCWKGDRKLIDIARAMQRKEIVRLLETYEIINEFVCTTFACNIPRMISIVGLGTADKKVNTMNCYFHAGYTWNRFAEYIQRPLFISALELCSPEVVEFLIKFGADLTRQYEETSPCGPVSFWAFRDHISNTNTMVVAKHADLALKDEYGATMLHRLVHKKCFKGKLNIVSVMLDRGIDVAAKGCTGSTVRDYSYIFQMEGNEALRQMIDNHVLEYVNNDQYYELETLLINAYHHIIDIRGLTKMRTASEIANIKQFDQMLKFLREYDKYKEEIEELQEATKFGNLFLISKLSGERRNAWARDKAGRTLLHIAVLFEHHKIIRFLLEQYPLLINLKDNLNRTALHYCVCLKEKHPIWSMLQEAGADPKIVDVNNMTVYDYVRELEKPVPVHLKPRGRRKRNYQVSKLLELERTMNYGGRADAHEQYRQLLKIIESEGSMDDVRLIIAVREVDLVQDDLDKLLLARCMELDREETAMTLVTCFGCRSAIDLEVKDKDGVITKGTLMDFARNANMHRLVTVIQLQSEATVEAADSESFIHLGKVRRKLASIIQEQEEPTDEMDEEGDSIFAFYKKHGGHMRLSRASFGVVLSDQIITEGGHMMPRFQERLHSVREDDYV